MSRPVYLIVYPSPLFPAHWALWLPYYTNGSEESVGKYINILGDSSTGFSLDIRRAYDLTTTSSKKSQILLCQVDAHHIVDVADPWSPKSTPVDAVEQVASNVHPPGTSLRSAGSADGSGLRPRIEVKNCQTWLREVVVALAGNETFPNEAIGVLDQAPKN
ncbi:hypothetical protein V491_05279 [Pseudogymnoascus sp. VKM F-3775]|nr:hypothetical protein V491_05279 [Pseudogymnoascus sp. VKM F-3775]